jgi:hypothetical protein
MEDVIDDQTWWARLRRKMQADLIACMDIPFQGYFEIQPEDIKRARDFFTACQVK